MRRMSILMACVGMVVGVSMASDHIEDMEDLIPDFGRTDSYRMEFGRHSFEPPISRDMPNVGRPDGIRRSVPRPDIPGRGELRIRSGRVMPN